MLYTTAQWPAGPLVLGIAQTHAPSDVEQSLGPRGAGLAVELPMRLRSSSPYLRPSLQMSETYINLGDE